jgi:hypothetical protein
MLIQSDLNVMAKTARENGAVDSRRSLVAKYLLPRKDIYKDQIILDFGAGPKAKLTQLLYEEGFETVIAYENLDSPNFNEHIHYSGPALNLVESFNLVIASNVLNVQPNTECLAHTIKEILLMTQAHTGNLLINYPASPRKMSDWTAKHIKVLLDTHFSKVEHVGGTKQAPLWLCHGKI